MFVVVFQSICHVQFFVTPWTTVCQASLSFTISWSLLKLMSIKLVMPSNHFIFCCPLSSCLQYFPGSGSFPMSQLFTFRSDQSLSRVRLFATPWIAARQASLSITNSRSSPRFMSIESVMPSSHFILCRPLLLLPPIPPRIRVFSNESTLRMRWPKYWSFSLSIIPSKEIPGLISFRMDWFDLLQNGLVGSPCSPRDSQESSPTPQFKSINSSALILLHSQTLTSIHDHRKNHSLD